MKQGFLELSLVGIAFLALQIWWINMTIRNGRNKKVIETNLDPLEATKKRLENILRE
tara:strand:- start:200 stop:370 length:171 start_codon:yes stop_codon:yes gene_type:complete